MIGAGPRRGRAGGLVATAALVVAASVGAGEPTAAVLARVAEASGVEVVAADPTFPVAGPHGEIAGSAASARELDAYAGPFAREFSIYPRALLRRAGLDRVVLCVGLSFAGQRRAAIPDFPGRTLYLDVARGAHSPAYQRRVIHHEFFHMIDLADDGRLYRDDAWSALNPPAFRYGDGGRRGQHVATTSVPTAEAPGFLDHYATTGVEEDKAETFALLMVDPEYVARRAGADAVLAAKVARLKSGLAAFCPEAGDALWAPGRSAGGPGG